MLAQTNAEISRFSSDAWLRRIQWLTLIAGLILLGIYGLAAMDAQVYSRLALWAFASAHSPQTNVAAESSAHSSESLSNISSNGPASASPANAGLWSSARLGAYRQSLLHAVSMPSATLSMPRLGIEAPVFEGTDAVTLNRGLGRIAGTAKFGESGNIGVAGHRDSFFRALKDVAPGDSIEVSTSSSRDAYVVDRVQIVEPSDVSVLAPGLHPGITLVTCYPFYFAGAAPRRFVVHATLRQRSSQAEQSPAQHAPQGIPKEN